MDDLIATTSQAFLGLTVGCARCHDHKIDPIPQNDYYGMAALLRRRHRLRRPRRSDGRTTSGTSARRSEAARRRELRETGASWSSREVLSMEEVGVEADGRPRPTAERDATSASGSLKREARTDYLNASEWAQLPRDAASGSTQAVDELHQLGEPESALAARCNAAPSRRISTSAAIPTSRATSSSPASRSCSASSADDPASAAKGAQRGRRKILADWIASTTTCSRRG